MTFGGGDVTVTTPTAAPVAFAGAVIHPTVSARAVASYDQTPVPASLFAQDCTPATLSQPITSARARSSAPTRASRFPHPATRRSLGPSRQTARSSISAHNNDTLGDMLYGDPAETPAVPLRTLFLADRRLTAHPRKSRRSPPSPTPTTRRSPPPTARRHLRITAPTDRGRRRRIGRQFGDIHRLEQHPIPAGTSIVNNVIQGTVTINGSWGMTGTPVTMCALAFNLPNNRTSPTDVGNAQRALDNPRGQRLRYDPEPEQHA